MPDWTRVFPLRLHHSLMESNLPDEVSIVADNFEKAVMEAEILHLVKHWKMNFGALLELNPDAVWKVRRLDISYAVFAELMSGLYWDEIHFPYLNEIILNILNDAHSKEPVEMRIYGDFKEFFLSKIIAVIGFEEYSPDHMPLLYANKEICRLWQTLDFAEMRNPYPKHDVLIPPCKWLVVGSMPYHGTFSFFFFVSCNCDW